ncbi:MAG: hypothetical protein KGQ41_00760 [Alphaproteobacteria bacterium]|nr:hypothetical protein [Alphaproteobacteria bacterium]
MPNKANPPHARYIALAFLLAASPTAHAAYPKIGTELPPPQMLPSISPRLRNLLQEEAIGRLPNPAETMFEFAVPRRLLSADMLKGFAGTPVVITNSHEWESETAFREWMAANAPKAAAKLDEADNWSEVYARFNKQKGQAFLIGDASTRFLLVDLPGGLINRLLVSEAIQIVMDAHFAARTYKSLELFGIQGFKPQAVIDTFIMSQSHGNVTDAAIERYVARNFHTQPHIALPVFLAWYADIAGVKPLESGFETLKRLETEAAAAYTALMATPEEGRIAVAKEWTAEKRDKKRLIVPTGIRAALGRAYLAGLPVATLRASKINLITPMRDFVTPLGQAPVAPNLAPRR